MLTLIVYSLFGLIAFCFLFPTLWFVPILIQEGLMKKDKASLLPSKILTGCLAIVIPILVVVFSLPALKKTFNDPHIKLYDNSSIHSNVYNIGIDNLLAGMDDTTHIEIEKYQIIKDSLYSVHFSYTIKNQDTILTQDTIIPINPREVDDWYHTIQKHK